MARQVGLQIVTLRLVAGSETTSTNAADVGLHMPLTAASLPRSRSVNVGHRAHETAPLLSRVGLHASRWSAATWSLWPCSPDRHPNGSPSGDGSNCRRSPCLAQCRTRRDDWRFSVHRSSPSRMSGPCGRAVPPASIPCRRLPLHRPCWVFGFDVPLDPPRLERRATCPYPSPCCPGRFAGCRRTRCSSSCLTYRSTSRLGTCNRRAGKPVPQR